MGRKSNPTSGFGGVVRGLRMRQGMTQDDLAADAQITPGYLAKVELNSVGVPSRKIIRRLADALEVPVEVLLEHARDRVPERIATAFQETPDEVLWFCSLPKRTRRKQFLEGSTDDDERRHRERMRRLARKLSNP